jgi:hypothetical protein
MEQVTVEIDADGNPTVKVTGVKGSGCKKLTADLEAALGKVTDSKNTREFAERPATENQIKAR